MSAALATVFDVPTMPAIRDLAVRTAGAQPEIRGPDHDHDHAVLALWLGLVEGRLRIVERFDRGNRRYFVIKDSDQPTSPLTSLLPRERRLVEILGSGESEKVAAFTLGIGAPAVSMLLKSALAKLGLRSRTELVLLVRSMQLCEAPSP
jgi:DNA-binding NarL/FixJ family response regulator